MTGKYKCSSFVEAGFQYYSRCDWRFESNGSALG
jgi:hypothetical protein